jgi:hypothetical protein
MTKKEINISKFFDRFLDELKDFKKSQLLYSSQTTRTMEEWVENFLFFSGYSEEKDEFLFDEHDEDLCYDDFFEIEDFVTRKKYNSWKEEDSF